MNDWFTVEAIDNDTHIISEYGHWEETHCYLLTGTKRSLLIDTGLGICNIYKEIIKLTDKPVTAVATHIHWDHIGGHKYFPDFYAHKAEVSWLNGKFPLSLNIIKKMISERCELPDEYEPEAYEIFQGIPKKILTDSNMIDIGGRVIHALHTPGHSPGHMCFFEANRGYLFTGDLIYKGTLFACYPSTDPKLYLSSVERVSELSARRIFPGHHSLNIKPEIIFRMKYELRKLNKNNKLCHGSGFFDYGDWSLKL